MYTYILRNMLIPEDCGIENVLLGLKTVGSLSEFTVIDYTLNECVGRRLGRSPTKALFRGNKGSLCENLSIHHRHTGYM